MSSTQLALNLIKGTEHDFEFYPTTYEMLRPIYQTLGPERLSVLDIGCGTCHFKKHLDTWNSIRAAAHAQMQKTEQVQYPREYNPTLIDQYFVIEKSRPLLDLLDKETICLGTDFHTTNLIDKPADIIFCNPPYSEYEAWAEKIIRDGNANAIYLIIPQRWKDSERIQIALKLADLTPTILGNFDFLDADRAARAKVDVIKLSRPRYGRRKSEINDTAFDIWFDETFGLKGTENERCSEYETSRKSRDRLKNQVAASTNKAEILVQLYNQEMETLFAHFKAICDLDADVLEAIGIRQVSVKSALKQKLKGLKILYWQALFDELEEITSRLTSETRKQMLERFSSLTTVEFCHENIYPLVLWVIKNANSYFNDQLIKFYKDLSEPENVNMYKSNQKTFKNDRWRFRQEASHYTLDYRIVAGYIFRKRYENELNYDGNAIVIDDICAIAGNLGFTPEPKYKTNPDGQTYLARETPRAFGEKYYIKLAKGGDLMEYKIYKNGNTHIKLNIEFAKAMNVEVARLLGWIRDKADIAKQFTPEMAKGAEQYFKANTNISLAAGTLPLLTANPKGE